MNSGTSELKEIEEQFQQILQQQSARRLAEIDIETQAYLALAPVWTRDLAGCCLLENKDRWQDFWDRAQSAQLIECQESTGYDGRSILLFWMPDSVRNMVVEQLRERQGQVFLARMARRLGVEIGRFATDAMSVPPVTLRW